MTMQVTDIAVEATALDNIKATDLKTIIGNEGGFEGFRVVPIGSDGYRQSVVAEMIWHRTSARAGIAYGAEAQWTDCDGAQDAAERFFGLNGKEMSN